MHRKVNMLFRVNLCILVNLFKFYGLIYIRNDSKSYNSNEKSLYQKFKVKLWQFWSISLIFVVGILTIVMYKNILPNILDLEDYEHIIEDSLYLINISLFLLSCASIYITCICKRKKLVKLLKIWKKINKKERFDISNITLSCPKLVYFLSIKIIFDIFSCVLILLISVNFGFITSDDFLFIKVLNNALLLSIFSFACTTFYVITLYFVFSNYCFLQKFDDITVNDKDKCSLKAINTFNVIVDAQEKLTSFQMKVFEFFELFIFVSISYLFVGFISDMTHLFLTIYNDEIEYKEEIALAVSYLTLYLSQLYAFCHGSELLRNSVSLYFFF